jgi:hypothetical protein
MPRLTVRRDAIAATCPQGATVGGVITALPEDAWTGIVPPASDARYC